LTPPPESGFGSPSAAGTISSSEVDISVIVPTRNRAALLIDCLGTLAAQNCHASFEVLIVDNGSGDETPRVVEEWCRGDDRFRAIRELKSGRSAAMNSGIRSARGRLLLFTDDDVLVDPGWIEAYRRLFASRSGEFLIAGGPIVPIPQDLGPWPVWLDAAGEADLFSHLDWRSERPLFRFEHLWGANMAIPVEAFARLGLWDEALGRRGEDRGTYEDYEFQERVRAAGGSVWFCPSGVIRHRIDRSLVTPRRVLRAAFTRGSNDYWREVWRRRTEVPRRGPGSFIREVLRLWRELVTWLLWTVRFRLRPRRENFRQAHRGAWRTAWAMEQCTAARRPQWGDARLQSGSRLDPLTNAPRTITLLLRRLTLRVAPGRPRPQ